MRIGIVNYITRNGTRPFGQKRLVKSLIQIGYEDDIICYNDGDLESPSHKRTPYAFKLYALKELERIGYDLALWVDASFWAVRQLDGLFSLIEKEGVVVQDSGHSLGTWSTSESLKILGIDREDAFSIMMFSGGLQGYNLRDAYAAAFLNEFYEYAKEGTCFRGSWKNKNNRVSKDPRVHGHRHDMVVGTALMKKTGRQIQPNNSLFCYYKWYQDYKDILPVSPYFLIEGGKREI